MQVNQQIQGSHCGAEFGGVITEVRCLTVRTGGCFEFMVKLWTNLMASGTERDALCIDSSLDVEHGIYARHTDFLTTQY